MSRKLRAILKSMRGNVPLILTLAQTIYAKMTASSVLYPNPPVSLATLTSQTSDLSDAQKGVKLRTVLASVRDTKLDALLTTMETLRMFVQGLVNSNPEQGAALIESAGFSVAAFTTYAKPLLAAKVGKVSGVVILVANAKLLSASTKRKFYNWQYSTNNGATWVSAPSTPYARTTLTGLAPATTVSFRVSVTDPGGPGDWSQPVSLLVH